MLRRQRTILRILNAADGKVSATQLQKYIFLLREETFLGRDESFYEFLPYKYGAFSFAAQRETEALTAYGYIEGSGASFGVTKLGQAEAHRVDGDTSRAVLAIISTYGKVPLRNLLKDVYSRYPWYAANSELRDLVPPISPKPRSAAVAVYTIGYENRSVDGFLNKLLREGIQRIIDVRSNPASRKYGFARSTLSNLAEKIGIAYSHFPELGITSLKRREVQTHSDFQELFKYYERKILPANTDAAAKVARLINEAPSVLVCMEKEAVDCHRGRLATQVATLTGLNIIHL